MVLIFSLRLMADLLGLSLLWWTNCLCDQSGEGGDERVFAAGVEILPDVGLLGLFLGPQG